MEVIDGAISQNSSGSWGKAWRDFQLVLWEQLMTLGQSWPWYVFIQSLVPLGFVFAFGHYAGVIPGVSSLIYIISGSVTFTLAYLGLTSMAFKLANMWQTGVLIHYYSLPINKVSLVMALLCARMLLLLPSIFVPFIAARLIYQVELNFDLWLLLIVALAAFSLAVIGTTIGVGLKKPDQVSVITNGLVFIVMLFSPTFMSVEALPLPLQLFGWLLPTTYVSNALSHSLSRNYDGMFFIDIVVLTVIAGLALTVNLRYLVWRVE